jgi:hypothetical protein
MKAVGPVVIAGLAYFALAQIVFALIGRPVVLGVPQGVANVALLAVAILVFVLLAGYTSRTSGSNWLRRTTVASAAAAMLGALAHTITLGVQVRWGERCNQCTPVTFMIELTLMAGILAAVAAVPVALISRRLAEHSR